MEAVELMGEKDIAGIETSTGTFVCEGYLHHNTYGNRMADNHEQGEADKSKRITYRHKLGRKLSARNTGGMQWGEKYRVMHLSTWRQVYRVLKPGGEFVLNVRNHYRKGEIVPVAEWHDFEIQSMGFRKDIEHYIPTPGMRYGANGHLRVDGEFIIVYTKPEAP